MLASLYLSLTHILLAMHERPALTIAPAAAAADTGMDQAPPLATSTKVHYVQGLLDELASTQEYQELADGLGAVYNLLVHRGSQIHRQHMGGDDSLRELLDTRRRISPQGPKKRQRGPCLQEASQASGTLQRASQK